MTNAPYVSLYTDGACSGNPGPGGYGAVLIYGEHKRKLSGYEYHTTNNKMELMAVIKGLECLLQPVPILIITDSQYVKDAFTKDWISTWKRNGWKTAAGGAVKNQDLWERLHALVQKNQVSWKWVKGHSGDFYNEMCDSLARAAIVKKSGIDEKF